MFLLNLSIFQLGALFGSIAAVSVALYLLDRSRRKQVVSTLRFWVAAEQPAAAARRRHIQQPWSLILQLISMALLLLAIAQLRFGTPAQAGRDHVIILDRSAWMAARSGNRSLMDIARLNARQYLRSLPTRDRVMLVRADALATPATAFEPDHSKVDAAILQTQPGSTALNLDQAMAFARHVQSQSGRRTGEITFIGTGRMAERDASAAPAPKNLRFLPVADTIENCGLRRIGLRRQTAQADDWEIYISARNYGTRPRTVTLSLEFGPPNAAARTPAGSASLVLPAGGEAEATIPYHAAAAGILGVKLTPHDAFPDDDEAELELPPQRQLPVTVYSNEPEILKPALSSATRVAAVYKKPSEYRADDPGLVVLDRFIPPQRPATDSIWIDPPAQGSPIAVRRSVEKVPFTRWDPVHPAAAGLRTKDFILEHASVYETAADDGRIGEVEAGPVIVARAGKPKIVVLGFHPALSAMRYELATPLLFANLLRWMSPEVFRQTEVAGGSVGSVKLALDQELAAGQVKVMTADAAPIPFTLRQKNLEFFSGSPGQVRVVAADHEYLYSLTLPQLGDARWDPPEGVHRGIPHFAPVVEAVSDVWPWLAILGVAGLAAEWWLYGRFRMARFARRPFVAGRAAAEVGVAEVRR